MNLQVGGARVVECGTNRFDNMPDYERATRNKQSQVNWTHADPRHWPSSSSGRMRAQKQSPGCQ